MLSTICWRTPPRHYGPWEMTASLIAEGLVKRGVDVTLFATGDSQTKAKLEWTCPRPVHEDPELDYKVEECLHISNLIEQAKKGHFDLIHNHFDFLPLTYSQLVDSPIITTIEGFSSKKILSVYKKYNRRTHYVSISNADRYPNLRYVATIYHGINVDEFPFSKTGGERLLFLGRISPQKGTHLAIEVARRCRRPLTIGGIIQDQCYFDERVKPFIDGKEIRYIGPVMSQDKGRLLAESYCLLHLIDFEEPFGLVMIESMACGTPVIAFRRGSIPEVIDSGKTGYIVEDINEAIEMLPLIPKIGRGICREHVKRYFTADRMVDEYLKVFNFILSKKTSFR